MEKELDKLEKAGVIKKSENCQWGTPLVPVLKPNGELRGREGFQKLSFYSQSVRRLNRNW